MATAAGVPELDYGPFSRGFLEDPFPHHARLRDVRAAELAGLPVRRCNNTLRGLASLPLRFLPA